MEFAPSLSGSFSPTFVRGIHSLRSRNVPRQLLDCWRELQRLGASRNLHFRLLEMQIPETGLLNKVKSCARVASMRHASSVGCFHL